MNRDNPLGICRFCGGSAFAEPVIALRDIPTAAQGFVDAKDLDTEDGEDLVVRECDQCGLVQIEGPPVPYYREVIRASGISPEMRAYREAQFSSFAERYGLGKAAVIEIGCGRGEYLSILAPFVGQACGLEASPDAVAVCQRAGLRVVEGFPNDALDFSAIPPCSGFLMLNFLEHIPEPNAFFQHVASMLTENAIGLIEVPNADMIFRDGLFSEFIRDHIFYFTQETLCRLLACNGFDVISCAVTWHNYTITAEVRKRSPQRQIRHNLATRMDSVCGTLSQDITVRKQSGKRIAVWGAGHQALALLAIANVKDEIAYVVDSAPFKQGRFTPATHLAIVPPATLATDPVDVVLVICGSYSTEVAAILARDYLGIEVGLMTESGIHWRAQKGQS